MSVIESFTNAFNDLYIWVYGHHKVCYYADILKRFVDEVDTIESTGTKNEWICSFFNYTNIVENLICDDEIWSLLKQKKNRELWQSEELLSRSGKYVSIWKSSAEFRNAFHTARAYDIQDGVAPIRSIELIIKDKKLSAEFLCEALNYFNKAALSNQAKDGSPLLIFVHSNIKEIYRSDWVPNVLMPDGGYISFVELMETASRTKGTKPESENTIVFYAYAHQEFLEIFPKFKNYKKFAEELIEFYHRVYKHTHSDANKK